MWSNTVLAVDRGGEAYLKERDFRSVFPHLYIQHMLLGGVPLLLLSVMKHEQHTFAQ
jgi:hypothetical protein